LVLVLEYLCDKAPRPPTGLSAFEVMQGYALASNMDKLLAPFTVPLGLAETDVAARLFANFRDLYGIFNRMTGHVAMAKQIEINRKRHVRVFDKGEIVFRKLPAPARPGKHL